MSWYCWLPTALGPHRGLPCHEPLCVGSDLLGLATVVTWLLLLPIAIESEVLLLLVVVMTRLLLLLVADMANVLLLLMPDFEQMISKKYQNFLPAELSKIS